jgi:hypothetical protein
MSGDFVFCNGGPIGWLGERQDRTSLSLCEAEIWATSATSKKVVDIRNFCKVFIELGCPMSDIETATTFYNDNNACV